MLLRMFFDPLSLTVDTENNPRALNQQNRKKSNKSVSKVAWIKNAKALPANLNLRRGKQLKQDNRELSKLD